MASKKIDLSIFIEEIKKYPCLYSKTDKNFKNIVLKQALWTSIGTIFGLSGEEAEKRWKVQRDRYNKERKKISCSKHTGAGTADVYSTKWHLYDLVGSVFIMPNENPNTYTNLPPDYSIESESMGFSEENDSVIFASEKVSQYDTFCMSNVGSLLGEKLPEEGDNASASVAPGSPSTLIAPEYPSTPIAPLNKRERPANKENLPESRGFSSCSSKLGSQKKRKRENELLTDLQATTNSINNYFAKKSKESQPDITSTFCNYIEMRLRNLSDKRRRKTIRDFEAIIGQQEIEQEEEEEMNK